MAELAEEVQAAGLVGRREFLQEQPAEQARQYAHRQEEARPAPDLVQREFTADAPDRQWVADITYIPTWVGFLYLAVVLDAFIEAARPAEHGLIRPAGRGAGEGAGWPAPNPACRFDRDIALVRQKRWFMCVFECFGVFRYLYVCIDRHF